MILKLKANNTDTADNHNICNYLHYLKLTSTKLLDFVHYYNRSKNDNSSRDLLRVSTTLLI